MNITLTGNLGSGKSTICKIICDRYGYEKYSTGVILRELAEERGITVLEMNELMKTDSKYDHMIDDAVAKISRERINDPIIFDSRLAWHFAEKSFKVFLSVSLDEAARRVYGDSRGDVETYTSVEDARAQLKERAEVEDARYKDFYKIDYFNFYNYNLILDSTCAAPEQLATVLMDEYNHYVAKNCAGGTRVIMSVGRFGFKTASTTSDKLVCETSGIVLKKGEDLEVADGLEKIKTAAENGYTFVVASLAPADNI